MSANMTRLAQVCGMSTRQSLNRPRNGVTSRWQGERILDDRLNKAACRGFDGPATAVWNRGKVYDGKKFHDSPFPRTEKIWASSTSVKHLARLCQSADPTWKPHSHIRKADREKLNELPKTTAHGLLG